MKTLLLCLAGLCALIGSVRAQSPAPDVASAMAGLMATLEDRAPQPGRAVAKVATTEPPMADFTPQGRLWHLASPPGKQFRVGTNLSSPETVARNFAAAQRTLLGLNDPRRDFIPGRVRGNQIRLQETFGGVPVFAGELLVNTADAGGVQTVVSKLAPDLTAFEKNQISLTPTLPPSVALEVANYQATNDRPDGAAFLSTPKLMIFAPEILGMTGAPQLVWEVKSGVATNYLLWQWFVDAHTGTALHRIPLVCELLNRRVYDANGTTNNIGTLVRPEGQGPSGITDVDNLYDYLGDTYNFYASVHGRDGWNNAGGIINASARYCSGSCPWANANSTGGGNIHFGAGWVADDVVAHEFTHEVTGAESDLIYQNASGAINESFSDIWGEFVDLTNGRGNDNATNRWKVSEDINVGAIRDMKNPNLYAQPDRLGGAFYCPYQQVPSAVNDYGGVHCNSGVNNKLCYLLTDGDTFNGKTITGMGLTNVVRLYYHTQTNNLLPRAASWFDLYFSLKQSAIALGWSAANQTNLENACQAVEISFYRGSVLWVYAAYGCAIQNGLTNICLPSAGPMLTVSNAVNSIALGGTVVVRGGTNFTYPERMTINKNVRITAYDKPATIGR